MSRHLSTYERALTALRSITSATGIVVPDTGSDTPSETLAVPLEMFVNDLAPAGASRALALLHHCPSSLTELFAPCFHFCACVWGATNVLDPLIDRAAAISQLAWSTATLDPTSEETAHRLLQSGSALPRDERSVLVAAAMDAQRALHRTAFRFHNVRRKLRN